MLIILIECITILPLIDNWVQSFDVTTVFIDLCKYIFSYIISQTIFDLTIRKLNAISQSIEEQIWVL